MFLFYHSHSLVSVAGINYMNKIVLFFHKEADICISGYHTDVKKYLDPSCLQLLYFFVVVKLQKFLTSTSFITFMIIPRCDFMLDPLSQRGQICELTSGHFLSFLASGSLFVHFSSSCTIAYLARWPGLSCVFSISLHRTSLRS